VEEVEALGVRGLRVGGGGGASLDWEARARLVEARRRACLALNGGEGGREEEGEAGGRSAWSRRSKGTVCVEKGGRRWSASSIHSEEW